VGDVGDAWHVEHVESLSTLASALDRTGARTLVLDLALGAGALRALRGLAGRRQRVTAVVIADPAHPEMSAEALRLGALDVLGRPIRHADLMVALGHAREFQDVAFRVRRSITADAEDGFHEAEFHSASLVGRSGRGDTCLGSYVAARLGARPGEATLWAAAVTSLKMEAQGPIRKSREEIEEFMRRTYATV